VEVLTVRTDKPITELKTTMTRDDGTVALEGKALCYTMPIPLKSAGDWSMFIVSRTGLTLVAFAANSLLRRMARGGELIDPVFFTTLRLVSGAIILVPVGNWWPSLDRFLRGSVRRVRAWPFSATRWPSLWPTAH